MIENVLQLLSEFSMVQQQLSHKIHVCHKNSKVFQVFLSQRGAVLFIKDFYVQGQGQDFCFTAKTKDTKLFQGQLQGQAKIRIATTDTIVERNSKY